MILESTDDQFAALAAVRYTIANINTIDYGVEWVYEVWDQITDEMRISMLADVIEFSVRHTNGTPSILHELSDITCILWSRSNDYVKSGAMSAVGYDPDGSLWDNTKEALDRLRVW